jgi:N utilization substance protein B
MARRSRAREVALQLLFQQDQNKIPLPRPAVERFARDRLRDPDLIAFSLTLFDGVTQHQAEIDKAVSATAENWRLHRMMPVDRNVLRLGTFELLHEPEKSPVAAILNEAIELARRFGTEESSKFVNGVLDKIARSRGEGRGARGGSEDQTQPQTDTPMTP